MLNIRGLFLHNNLRLTISLVIVISILLLGVLTACTNGKKESSDVNSADVSSTQFSKFYNLLNSDKYEIYLTLKSGETDGFALYTVKDNHMIYFLMAESSDVLNSGERRGSVLISDRCYSINYAEKTLTQRTDKYFKIGDLFDEFMDASVIEDGSESIGESILNYEVYRSTNDVNKSIKVYFSGDGFPKLAYINVDAEGSNSASITTEMDFVVCSADISNESKELIDIEDFVVLE